MKMKTDIKKGMRLVRTPFTKPFRNLLVGGLLLFSAQATLQAQTETYTRPSWFFGVAGGVNYNDYRGTTQQLNSDFTAPAGFRKGNGLGLYLAPLVEFHKPDSHWGVMLQVGYDDRSGDFDQITTPCNCPADLNTNLTYITVEPSLRFQPFKSNFYMYGGPRVAIGIDKEFSYKQAPAPNSPAGKPSTEVKGDFSETNKTLISMQIGAGYDIQLSSKARHTQFVISPFVAFHPYLGQEPRSIETWTLSTLRGGVAFKFGRGHKVSNTTNDRIIAAAPAVADVKFTVVAPANVPVERRVRETFPLRNYVFFDLGSSKIADRYVLLKKEEVKDFKEDQLEVMSPKKLTGRSDREMEVYYNILNILGDRMGKYPASTVRLSGASMQGEADGLAMAQSIKAYLVDIFGIAPARITTEGTIKPRIASETPGSKSSDLSLIREGDRRVSIYSTSPELLQEFQSGPEGSLKPVTILTKEEAPIDSYVVFNVDGAYEALSSWSLVIIDDKGISQNYGPFTLETVSIAGKTILGTKPSGNYHVIMNGKTKSGGTVKKEADVHMILWTPGELEEGMRYSVIYEFDEAQVIPLYAKYLTEVVTPKIPVGAKVIIHGHSDIIGEPIYNQKLSLARSNDVKSIIKKALAKAGRTDVTFDIYGFGEDKSVSPFANKYPEERFYNRTVIIDIIPKK